MNTGIFPPSKRRGLLLHGILLVVLGIVVGWALLSLSVAGAGLQFVAYLMVSIVAFAPIPLLAYRAYALLRAQYILDRNSLQLRWGLREEVIPLSDIEWVRSREDLTEPLTVPPLSGPGAILGLRRHRDLGVVEFLASARKDLLLVATPRRVYAISPADPAEFIQTFARAVELGSLKTAGSKSTYPSFIVTQAWESGAVRFAWLAALFLNLGLVAWVSLLVPTLGSVVLGSRPGQAPDAVPSIQLVILPVLSASLNLAGWATGLFFYRWGKWRNMCILIWGAGALTTLLFLVSVVFIVSTPA
jgi:hypothetical protein